MRKQCYPRWIEQHKMRAGAAAHEIAVMAAIVADYEEALMKESVG